MQITVVRPGELGASELDRWRQLQQAQPRLQSPFLAPEFTLAVGRSRRTARVAVFEDGRRIVGFFPYDVRRRVVGVPIGHGISDCQGVIHQPGLGWDPVQLLRACKIQVWEFDHLLADQAPFQPYQTMRTGSPIMDLAKGYQNYVDDRMRSGDVVRQTLRKQRRMVRDLGDERFEWEDRSQEALTVLRRWKSAQYRRTQQYDRFHTPWIAAVLEDLLHSPAAGCRAVVSMLYAGDRPVAGHLGLRSRSVLAYWFPSYERELSTYSAGMLLCLRLAEAGAADGIEHIDLGKSAALYKDRLRNDELPVAEGRVARSTTVAAAYRAQAALSHGVRHGVVGQRLRVGRTGRVLRGLRARLQQR